MATRIELDRQIISRSNTDLYNELREKGYNVLGKSKSTKVMILWGAEKSAEQLQAERERAEIQHKEWLVIEAAQALRAIQREKEYREEMKKEPTISNLWKNFNRRPGAYMNIKKDSFYFSSPSGQKVRVSNHTCYHFQAESERAFYSRASDFEAPDYDFVINDNYDSHFEDNVTRAEVVEKIKSIIK